MGGRACGEGVEQRGMRGTVFPENEKKKERYAYHGQYIYALFLYFFFERLNAGEQRK